MDALCLVEKLCGSYTNTMGEREELGAEELGVEGRRRKPGRLWWEGLFLCGRRGRI